VRIPNDEFRLNPKRAIEGAVLDGFADVFGGDGVGGGEVGDGAGDFQDAMRKVLVSFNAFKSSLAAATRLAPL
jgi:hypothetical protein